MCTPFYSLGMQVVKGFVKMFPDVFHFLAWAAWHLQYCPNGLWNIHETFNQALFTTWRPRR